MTKIYCLECKQEVPEDHQGPHSCGGRSFLLGSIKPDGEGNFVCSECEGQKMRMQAHMDFTDRATWSFVCTNCGAAIGKEYYRDPEDMAYWE